MVIIGSNKNNHVVTTMSNKETMVNTKANPTKVPQQPTIVSNVTSVNNKTENRFTTLSSTWKMQEIRKKQRQTEIEKELTKKRNEKKICKGSEEISKEFQKKIFTNVFRTLDYEHKNSVGGSIDLNMLDLPNSVKEIVGPLLEELEEERESLTLEEFIIACEDLYKVLILILTVNNFTSTLGTSSH